MIPALFSGRWPAHRCLKVIALVLHRAPIGIFRNVEAAAYDDLAREQVSLAAGKGSDQDALQAVINGGDTWLVR